MGEYDAEFEPEDLPDEAPPDLIGLGFTEAIPETPLEAFIPDGNYVVYRQKPE